MNKSFTISYIEYLQKILKVFNKAPHKKPELRALFAKLAMAINCRRVVCAPFPHPLKCVSILNFFHKASDIVTHDVTFANLLIEIYIRNYIKMILNILQANEHKKKVFFLY